MNFRIVLLCTLYTCFVRAETVGLKEDIKNLSDEDVLVISVSHSKKDKNVTTSTEKSTSVESTTEVLKTVSTTLAPPIFSFAKEEKQM